MIIILALAGILFLLSLFLIVLGFTKRSFVAGSTTSEPLRGPWSASGLGRPMLLPSLALSL